ncbi:MAG: response regulator [Phycisphaerae bacterium]
MSTEQTKTIQVLWIRGDAPHQPEAVEWLGESARVECVDTVEQAVQALRRESFDLVVSGAADFTALERLHVAPEAEVILETVPQGVAIVGQGGQLVWANPKMLSFSQELRDRVCEFCGEMFSWAASVTPETTEQHRGRRSSIRTSDGQYFEITATPVIDLNQRMAQVSAVVWDATRALRLQERIDAIDAAGRELVRLDVEQITRLDAHERLSLLEQKIIRYMHDLMQMDNFIVYLLDRRTNKLEVALCSGLPDSAQNTDLYASAEGNGISGYVASRGRSYICPDVQADPRYLQGIEGARSCLTVPLRLHDQVIGAVNVESDQPAAFGEDDRQILEIFSRHVAVSLHILELLTSERSTATGRLGSDVLAEITGPVNDILTEVESLIEDYIGHDDLRHRLNLISQKAVDIRDSTKQVTSPRRGLVGRRPSRAATRTDPVLKDKWVLIADDEDVIRETVRDVLASYGCRVDEARDGKAAIELVATNGYDLVLSDIKMPGASGYEVFAASKDKDADRPVLLMTGFGYDPNHSIVRARREGLAAVLFKPFKVDQLLGEIRNAVRTASAGK